MAIDKDKLLQYFLTHYLSRQEVLFKLPLSVSIDSFWPELMNRRKARASVLSLYDPYGKPYWYVLTDKMVAASERLVEETMNQDERFDPYRAPMTSAMTEEMFFTSFVEGAQIPLQEAMDFLGRGTEPEDVQEQMIWNNRQAWSVMVKALYKPMDETFVKSLAYMLTDEMEGRADGYRQTDRHPIAAMHSEPYEVPTAVSLPDRMQEYYGFLQTPSVHPLIKAAVGQAYLLAARPFPEGNERLSRMISSAVLLRSGYDFFRDISISSMIARENYRYYKAMCEILRPENGSDLTYFIEYYIDLLARALEGKKERDKRHEDEQNKETLERERQMAQQPLGMIPSALSQQAPIQDTPSEMQAVAPQKIDATENPPNENGNMLMPQVHIHQMLRPSCVRSTNRQARVEKTLTAFVEKGIRSFSRQQWQEAAGIPKGTAQDDCGYMVQKGFVSSTKNGIYSTYTITVNAVQKPDGTVGTVSFSSMRQSLRELQKDGTDREKRIAMQIITMLDQGITRFTHAEWCERTGLNKSVNNDDLRTAVNHSLIEQTGNGYVICEHVDQEKRFRTPTPMIRDAVTNLVTAFAGRSFSTNDAARQMSVKANTAAYCLEQLMQKGIVNQTRAGQRMFHYTFTKEFLAYRQMNTPAARSDASAVASSYPGIAAAPRASVAMQL